MTARIPQSWHREVDVVVLGSGAAGLVAAIMAHDGGATVLVLEKAPLFGGTTGISGGMPWVPMNPHMGRLGVSDTKQDAIDYLRKLTRGYEPDPQLLEVYVDHAHRMIEYLEEHTPLSMFATKGFADYYNKFPGSKQEGRSIESHPFAGSELGEWADRVRVSPIYPRMTLEEGSTATDPSKINLDMVNERVEKDIRTMGGAMVGALFKGLLDRGVEALTNTPGRELVMSDSGSVVGVRAEQDGRDFFVGARQGVVLATGGYEWNKELVKTFLKSDAVVGLSPPHNEGDGLVMAMEAGAALGNMGSAWWSPSLQDPALEFEGRPLSHTGSQVPRLPGAILVNRKGERFVNECTTYMDLPKTFYTFDPVIQDEPNFPAWVVFDDLCKSKFVVFTMKPGEPAPDWVAQGATLEELAKKIDVDPDGLRAQVERFNRFAADGIDPDFDRGAKDFGPFSGGDPDPGTTLAPLGIGPYYALRMLWGTLGTNGGAKVDEHGKVRSNRGGTVSGLFAAGNATAGVFGPTYPGGGATLGPAMTFGYLAGRAVAQETPRNLHR